MPDRKDGCSNVECTCLVTGLLRDHTENYQTVNLISEIIVLNNSNFRGSLRNSGTSRTLE